MDFAELFEKLTDFERTLKDKGSTSPPILATANVAQKQISKAQQFNRPAQRYNSTSNFR